jgi:hypothetical protein
LFEEVNCWNYHPHFGTVLRGRHMVAPVCLFHVYNISPLVGYSSKYDAAQQCGFAEPEAPMMHYDLAFNPR